MDARMRPPPPSPFVSPAVVHVTPGSWCQMSKPALEGGGTGKDQVSRKGSGPGKELRAQSQPNTPDLLHHGRQRELPGSEEKMKLNCHGVHASEAGLEGPGWGPGSTQKHG